MQLFTLLLAVLTNGFFATVTENGCRLSDGFIPDCIRVNGVSICFLNIL